MNAWITEEQALLDEHGETLTFQVHRVDLAATTIRELQGEAIAELREDGRFASGDDTVAAVKAKLLARLGVVRPDVTIGEGERIFFFFGGRPMQDDRLFYADHFMLLPAWVQVVLHSGDIAEVMARAREIEGSAARSG